MSTLLSGLSSTVSSGTLGSITSLVGTVGKAYGTYQEGRARSHAFRLSARAAASEAEVERQKAAREEEIQRAKVKRMMGTQRALFAAAGVDPSSGTPLEILASTVREGEKEVQWIRYAGETNWLRKMNEARMYRMYGKQAERAGRIRGISQFISGLSSINWG